MKCLKCGIEFNKMGILQHQNKCKLTIKDINNIITDYIINLLSIRNIMKKYNSSTTVIRRILKSKNVLKDTYESIKIFNSKKCGKITANETKEKISISMKEYLKNNPNKIRWIKNESAPSLKFKEILKSNNISFVEEYKPLEERYFNIDIAFINEKIGIEINGEQHYERDKSLKKYYKDRHDLIEKNGWKLYEIHCSLVYKKDFIENFIKNLKNEFKIGEIDYSFYRQHKKECKCSCGSLKSKYSKLCKKCFNIKRRERKVERPSYNILINDINNLGYKGTSRKYGVSDNAIRKWIKLYIKYGLNF